MPQERSRENSGGVGWVFTWRYELDGFHRPPAERAKMDNQTSKMEVFLKSLTEEQTDTCECDEKQLAEIFSAGWTEEAAVHFHRALLHARHVDPAVTVEGAFEVALRLGLAFIGDEEVLARLYQGREDDVVVYGVQRRDGKDLDRTSGTAHLDGGTLIKKRTRKPHTRKEGVR